PPKALAGCDARHTPALAPRTYLAALFGAKVGGQRILWDAPVGFAGRAIHLSVRPTEEVLMAEFTKPRAVGFNHVALEVGDIDEALAFYGRLFQFELRGKSDSMAFI